MNKAIIVTLHANSNHKRADMTRLVSDKKDFKIRNIVRDKKKERFNNDKMVNRS